MNQEQRQTTNTPSDMQPDYLTNGQTNTQADTQVNIQATAQADELYELRSLLLAGDPEERLNRSVTPEDISKVLPAALIEAQRQHPKLLTSSFVTTVESAIRASIIRDGNVLADSLYPVIGPSTRKSISAAIGDLVQSLNQTLEYSLSWRSIQWRLEAKRTGKTFAEVVLLRTLVYRVEQVFLIHGETGLMLQHVAAETAAAKDPDLISAMMTAIQDFVKDSFATPAGEGLSVLEVGELSVWIEEGPRATLACVIRGNAPETLHTTMQDAQEKIHLLFDAALRSFEGDTRGFEASQRYLKTCFQSQFQQTQKTQASPTSRRYKKVMGGLFAGCLAIGLVAWAALNWQAYTRWTNYISALEQEPGIVVISHQRYGGRYAVSGLRDPLAADPALMLAETDVDAEAVDMTWRPYLSLEAPFISHRLQALLNPPPSVSMILDDTGLLRLRGTAPAEWIEWAKEVSDRTAGINGWDARFLVPVEWPSVDEEANRKPIYFGAD